MNEPSGIGFLQDLVPEWLVGDWRPLPTGRDIEVLVKERCWRWQLSRRLADGWALREPHWLRPLVERPLLLHSSASPNS